eukprot:TRINITY_DN9116_c0_g1_i3.p1 TRINITY_DN9116_c0_g1~~TRINITY_DN9116_c0_g1_i3.p1  ORF type:complete len:342 (+),score=79.58 TRINITY_DN9116_c0_g1_i3:31-1056(+)
MSLATSTTMPLIRLSKNLSYVLRHGAQKEGFNMSPDGFVLVEDILKSKFCDGYTLADVQRVVQTNDKQRFALKEEGGILFIRANQGHSIKEVAVEMKPIMDASLYPVVVHGTYFKAWPAIKRLGLSRMKRNHIHMALGVFGADHVISGMRRSCELLIFIDLAAALQDGISFLLSDNQVVLTEGLDGVLPPKYFSRVCKSSDGLDYDPSFDRHAPLPVPKPRPAGPPPQRGPQGPQGQRKGKQQKQPQSHPKDSAIDVASSSSSSSSSSSPSSSDTPTSPAPSPSPSPAPSPSPSSSSDIPPSPSEPSSTSTPAPVPAASAFSWARPSSKPKTPSTAPSVPQ